MSAYTGMIPAMRRMADAFERFYWALSGIDFDAWDGKMTPEEFEARGRERRETRASGAVPFWVYAAGLLVWAAVIFMAVWGVMR